MFKDKTVNVSNAPFLSETSKVISKNSLTKKCLCKKHNELLSPYDEEAIAFAKALEYAADLSIKRRKCKVKTFSVHKKYVDLEKFARWYIKTYLGLIEFFDYPSNISEDALAKLVYQKSSIKNHVQLSLEMKEGEDFTINQVVSVAPLYSKNTTVCLQIELYGIRVRGIFTMETCKKQKSVKLKFNEQMQGLSCIVLIK